MLPVEQRERAVWGTSLALALLVGVFPQFALGALGPQIRADLGMSTAQLGVAFTALYLLGVAGSPLAGPLADRIGGRRGCLALLLLSGASLWAASFVSGPVGLYAAMLPAGAAMAMANPATTRWSAAAPTPATQASLVGIAQAGVQAGALVAGGLAASAALGLDWRNGFRVGTLLAAVGAVAAWLSPRDEGSAPRSVIPTPQPGPEQRQTRRGLAVYALLMGGGTAVVFAYLPSYGVDVIGLSVSLAGATTLLFGATALICRVLLGIALRDANRLGPALLRLLSFGAGCAVLLIALGARNEVALWLGTVLFGATGTTWPVAAYLAVLRHSAPGAAGKLTGWVTASFYLGLWTTPAIAGWLISTSGYALAWAGSVLCYLGAAMTTSRVRGQRTATT